MFPLTLFKSGQFSLSSRGRLFIALAAVLWSLAGVFIKSLSLPAVTIASYRFFFAGLFFFFFLRSWRVVFNRAVFFSIATYVLATGSFVWANKLTTAANAVVLQYTAPLYIYAIIPLAFGEKISFYNLLTMCGGMIGVGVIFLMSIGQPDILGISMALFSGFAFSLYIVNLRFLGGLSVSFMSFVNNFGGTVFFLPLALEDLYVSPVQLFALLLMGVFQFGVPYFVFSKGIETTSLQEASLIFLLEPVLNPLWVNLVVGEVPSHETLLGGSIILSSLALRYSFAMLKSNRS